MSIVSRYLITLLSFAVVDAIWLGVVARRLYRNQIGFLMGQTNWSAAVLFYVFYVAGLLFFVIQPASARQRWQYALLVGFFFGFITYMTYDLTNLATLEGWPALITVVDIAWGTVLGGATSLLSYELIRLIEG
ncbi:MAG: DUF2177 family protein [Anaerolineae bacterium]